jgi:hypothetical protein
MRLPVDVFRHLYAEFLAMEAISMGASPSKAAN